MSLSISLHDKCEGGGCECNLHKVEERNLPLERVPSLVMPASAGRRIVIGTICGLYGVLLRVFHAGGDG